MDENISQLIQQAEQLFKEKKYKEITELLTDALLKQYNNAALYAWRARAHERLNESEPTFLYANKAIEIDSLLPISYLARGNAWYDKKEYDKAIDDYSKAIALDKKYVTAYYNRGNVWFDKKEYDKAIDDYSRVIALDEKDSDAYFNRGNTWKNKREYDKAIDDYNKAIDLDEKYAAAYINRGNAWYDKKEYDKAINDYSNAIALDVKYAFAYYNRAISYNAFQKFNEAKADYERYIQLINDPSDYYSQVAQSNIKELERKLADQWYNEISELVTKIKQLLLFEQACVTHYTSLSAAKAMILHKSKLRFSEGAFLNDTSEGKELFKYLDFSVIKEKPDETLAETFTEKPFIGSFVTEAKHDDLTLWRMYGKEDNVEARGCAITINKDRCLSELKAAVSSKNDPGASMQTEEQFTFYKVAYISKDEKNKFVIPGDDKGDELTGLMNDLKTKLQVLNNEQKISVKELLNSIAYLFKSVEYQYENEVRLIVQGVGFEKTIDINANPPKVYIDLIDIIPVLTKITFGPKVERGDEWAAAFNYQIKKEITDSNIEIVISHLPFK